MTRAPDNILAVRRLLLRHLDVEPTAARSADLEPAEVGIVGDPAHRGGYHCGSDRVVTGDYSVTESDRDRNGLTEDASALDVGQFSVTSGGRTHNLQTFSVWCVEQCQAGAPDARDIREIIYSPDGVTVRRWDRLKRRTSGDSSHRWHTHFSFFRDAVKARRDLTPLFHRYLTTIGLIPQEDTLSAQDVITGMAQLLAYAAEPEKAPTEGLAQTGRNARRYIRAILLPVADQEGTSAEELTAALTAHAGQQAEAVASAVLAGLSPERIAAAVPAAQAEAVAQELARRLAD